ncbi:MAG: shikimate dehydrogenase [Candidatus Saccharicenans sp.]|uniref:shikimate dehydrogenase n=1 Tax=Candidatus Saccharicenans sp. TaxID=2819258 RepID=UPI004049979C
MQLGIIGNPVEHSISPTLFNYLFKRKSINLNYLPIKIAAENLGNFIKWFRNSGMLGLNVTIPFKESIYELLDQVEEPANKIKAVNTIHLVNGHLYGFNTDYYGFSESTKEFRSEIRQVLILGGGGAARAVLFSIASRSCQKIFLAERTAEKRKTLRKDFKDLQNLEIFEWNEAYIIKRLKQADLVINTTPLGLAGVSDSFPLKPDLPLENKIFYDLIYQPAITPFLKIGLEGGARIKNGLEMLIIQAMKSLEIWTGIKTEFQEWIEAYNSTLKAEKNPDTRDPEVSR